MGNFEKEKREVYRNVCPRNCYSTCSMLSIVENGKLVKVMGDQKHGYTEGKLCAKGYAYTQYTYSPERLKYPLLQTERGSGNWQRITWDEAFERIANKMLELNKRYGSNLSLGYNSFVGNTGFLHLALQGMFESFGPHTKPVGNLCLGTGQEALKYNVPIEYNPPPEMMVHSKLIVLWGANPARTNIHQMKFILRAKDKGATFVVIDPIFTDTARLADIYIQIRPGTDGYFVMGILKVILLNNWSQPAELKQHIVGWEDFSAEIDQIVLADVTMRTGVPEEAIREVARLYAHTSPISTWVGFGIQRKATSIQDLRAIDALVTVTGNRFIENGGLYYYHPEGEMFPLSLTLQGKQNQPNRNVNINHFAEEALNLSEPPIKFLWIDSKNPLSQDQNLSDWYRLFDQMELVVTTDLYMTHTAKMSDIVLPVTTHFEAMDLHVSYWNHWLSLNQQAIEPYYEARSDLEIVRGLVKVLNGKVADFSSFPAELEAIDWIKREINEDVKERYGLSSWEQLLERPYHLKSQFSKISNELQKCEKPFSFKSNKAVLDGLPALPVSIGELQTNQNKFILLSPQSLLKIHSQFQSLSWLNNDSKKGILFINETSALTLDLKNGEKIIIYNENGEVSAEIEFDKTLPENTVVINQGDVIPINLLIDRKKSSDLNYSEKSRSTPFYDIYVSLRKVGKVR